MSLIHKWQMWEEFRDAVIKGAPSGGHLHTALLKHTHQFINGGTEWVDVVHDSFGRKYRLQEQFTLEQFVTFLMLTMGGDADD